MDLVHDRGSMDPVHESGPWTRSKVGVHGPLVHVLSSPDISAVFFCYVLSRLPGAVFTVFEGERLEARKSLKGFFLQPNL